MLKISDQGLCYHANFPHYGSQALGASPKGALDQLSFQSAKTLLGEPLTCQIIEIVYPPKCEFTQDCLFVLTGAAFKRAYLKIHDESYRVRHATVIYAPAGSELILGKKAYGFRTYLAVTPVAQENYKRLNISRGVFSRWFSWYKIGQAIRVIEGPENKILKNKDQFLEAHWKISHHSDNMGLRLESEKPLDFDAYSMISEAVTDGTIQLTQSGPIVLMRHRQTIGGYPRIYNVISSDIDVLGQYMPGQTLHFETVSLEQAQAIHNQKVNELNYFREFFLNYKT